MTNRAAEFLLAGDKVRLKGSKKEYTVLGPPNYYRKREGSKHRELRVQLVDDNDLGLEVLAPQIQEIVT